MEEVHQRVMRITRTTETILSSGKRVCQLLPRPRRKNFRLTLVLFAVCVSSLMVDEIKRIIKTSEIMKYGFTPLLAMSCSLTLLQGRR